MLKILRLLFDLYKLIKQQLDVNPRADPTTVIIETASKEAASALAEKIGGNHPELTVVVTAVTAQAASALEDVIAKKVLNK